MFAYAASNIPVHCIQHGDVNGHVLLPCPIHGAKSYNQKQKVSWVTKHTNKTWQYGLNDKATPLKELWSRKQSYKNAQNLDGLHGKI